MSDVISTTPMCAQGRASVTEMTATFRSLVSNPAFNRARFEPTVTSIQQAFEANYSFYSEWIPFNPACSAVKDIGAQADVLTQAMLVSVGAATPGIGPGSTAPPIDFATLIKLALAIAGVFLVVELVQLGKLVKQ